MKKLIIIIFAAAVTTTVHAQPPLELICEGFAGKIRTTTAPTCPWGTTLIGYR